MLTTDAHTAALEWTTRALREELPAEDASSISSRAETLTAIAAAEGVPIDVLIQWIHIRIDDKEWSAAEWRRFSAKYRQSARTLRTIPLHDGI